MPDLLNLLSRPAPKPWPIVMMLVYPGSFFAFHGLAGRLADCRRFLR